jgi:hypothetical protein
MGFRCDESEDSRYAAASAHKHDWEQIYLSLNNIYNSFQALGAHQHARMLEGTRSMADEKLM